MMSIEPSYVVWQSCEFFMLRSLFILAMPCPSSQAVRWQGHDLLMINFFNLGKHHIHLSKLRAVQTVSLISMLSCFFLLQQHVQMAKLPVGQSVSFPCFFVLLTKMFFYKII
jgi:hypothetical protein